MTPVRNARPIMGSILVRPAFSLLGAAACAGEGAAAKSASARHIDARTREESEGMSTRKRLSGRRGVRGRASLARMAYTTLHIMISALEIGFELDRRWHWLRGEMEESKRPALVELARVFGESKTPYAVIGGIAVQVHQAEPRTTLDIDVAVLDRNQIPRNALLAAGFSPTGTFVHSENWMGPRNTPVRFTADPALHAAVLRAESFALGEVTLRIVQAGDLLGAKLRASADPARRRSKRLQDLADAQALIEKYPALAGRLSDEEQRALERLLG